MIHGRLLRADDRSCLIPRVALTDNWFERLRGLLGSPPPGQGEALLIRPCSSVHTFFMRFAIDLIFLDHEWRVAKTVDSLRPWRMAACPAAAMVLELAEGSLKQLSISRGIQLEWQDA
ncbi:MAG: DUF192 domain-containing protein [Gammaproteobacteria bacterium]